MVVTRWLRTLHTESMRLPRKYLDIENVSIIWEFPSNHIIFSILHVLIIFQIFLVHHLFSRICDHSVREIGSRLVTNSILQDLDEFVIPGFMW